MRRPEIDARYFGLKANLLLFVALFAISGCVYYRPASKLNIDTSLGWKHQSWVYGGVQQNWIYRNNISIMMRPHNYGEYSAVTVLPVPFIPIKPEDTKKRAYFAVSLVFDSSVNTWQGVPTSLKFNPYSVELRRQDGSVLRPAGYIRPMFNNFHCYDFDYDGRSLLGHVESSQPDKWLDFPEEKSGRCFYLIYDTPPPPPAEIFSFKIDELQLDGKALNVPTLIFHEGTD